MSGYWLRTAARMVILSFNVTVEGRHENGRNSFNGRASLRVPLRAVDQLTAFVELKVGQWQMRLFKGGTQIATYECGTEAGCRSKARRLIAAQLKALRPSYAAAEAEITASHTARGWVVL